jgi:tetratricopeptide (TPR) repeat protein
MHLFLKCTACGRVRAHIAQYALLDQGTVEKEKAGQSVRFDPCILDHEVVCPKCGARDRYELTSQANMVIYAPQDLPGLQAMLSGKEPESPPKLNPRVFYFTAMALGRKMHPLEAMEEYEWRIANHPGNAHLHMGLGNILRLLFRYEHALEELRFAYELAPQDMEVLVTLAMAEHDLGDISAAQELYVKALDLGERQGPPKDTDNMLAARQGLEALRGGKPSLWSAPVYNADGQPLPTLGRSRGRSSQQPASGKAGALRKRRK